MNPNKIDNHNLSAKLDLRRHLLKTTPAPLRVLDCFSGSETIWKTLRQEFAVDEYLALDKKSKARRIISDSLAFMRGTKWGHNIIDLDAYGMPWLQFAEVLNRGQPCLCFLTVGLCPSTKLDKHTLQLMGITFDMPESLGMNLHNDCIAANLGSVYSSPLRIAEAWEAPNPGGSAHYIGVRLVLAPSSQECRAGAAETTHNATC